MCALVDDQIDHYILNSYDHHNWILSLMEIDPDHKLRYEFEMLMKGQNRSMMDAFKKRITFDEFNTLMLEYIFLNYSCEKLKWCIKMGFDKTFYRKMIKHPAVLGDIDGLKLIIDDCAMIIDVHHAIGNIWSSPLRIALFKSNFWIANLLIQHGANLNCTDIEYTCNYSEFLCEHQKMFLPGQIIVDSQENHREKIKFLIKNGVKSECFNHLLCIGSVIQNVDKLEILLGELTICDNFVKCPESRCDAAVSPFILALELGYYDSAELLISYGLGAHHDDLFDKIISSSNWSEWIDAYIIYCSIDEQNDIDALRETKISELVDFLIEHQMPINTEKSFLNKELRTKIEEYNRSGTKKAKALVST